MTRKWQMDHAARALAEAANVAKSDFLANMSHEIRTPMTAILGSTEQLSHQGITPSERQDYLAIISRNAKHLLELINDILDLSKIEAGRFSLDRTRCSVASVVSDVASMMRVRADDRGLDLHVEYTESLPDTIVTDATCLRRALINLTGNAVKFTDSGQVKIIVTFLARWLERGPAVQFQIVDSGIGISPEKIDEVFEPFVQADESTSRMYGGTGLGLSITRSVAQLLGGELTATSTPGRGSVFTLTIPTGDIEGVKLLANPTESVRSTDHIACEQPDKTKPLTGLQILLVEDGLDNQLLISIVLAKSGAQVEIANNGRVAVDLIAERSHDAFDLILMDMQMPEMDGYEATRALRRSGTACPIIALTADAMSGTKDECLAAGCTDYCTKPIDRVHLIAIVARHTPTVRCVLVRLWPLAGLPANTAVQLARRDSSGRKVGCC